MLSNTSRYAMRAMIYLATKAEESKKIGIKKIAEELDIPAPFLGKILQQLAKNKLLDSTKGPNGGFSLPESSLDITLYDIVTVIDGDDLFTKCPIALNSCAVTGDHCSLHKKYGSVRENMVNLFKEKTVLALSKEIKDSDTPIII